MPTTIVEVYRDLPGAKAHHIWEGFAKDGGGLYLVGGSSYSGKSTFAEKIAVEAAKHLKFKAKDMVLIDFDNKKQNHPNFLSYINDPNSGQQSAEAKKQARQNYLTHILADVERLGAKVAVIDEVRSAIHAELAVRLSERGVIVFAIFRSYGPTTVIERFSKALEDYSVGVDTFEKPVHLAFLSLVCKHHGDGFLHREGFVEYHTSSLNIPTTMN